MQVLDKVTAETLQFEAPVGRAIRYKTLVMTVRVCETRGASDPRAAAIGLCGHGYARLSRFPAMSRRRRSGCSTGGCSPTRPALHALEHPIYDAWLVGCSVGKSGRPIVSPPCGLGIRDVLTGYRGLRPASTARTPFDGSKPRKAVEIRLPSPARLAKRS